MSIKKLKFDSGSASTFVVFVVVLGRFMILLDLPKDVLCMICKMVSEYDDLVALNRTCKKIHSLIKEQRLFDVVAHPNKIQRFYPDELKEKMRELDLFLDNYKTENRYYSDQTENRYYSDLVSVIMLGGKHVGKSACSIQYLEHAFPSDTYGTQFHLFSFRQ